jgi:ATP-binding cassette subfamily G (WHITE) protein 2 (PDR)
MWAQRPIVEKHDRYTFYHPFTEGVAAILCDLPAKFGTAVMFHVTLYFMTNLRRTASAFFTYFVFMFFIVLTMSMVFRTLGSLSRTLEQTMAPASIPVPYMKPWLSWFRRLNPMAYAYESLMINEVCVDSRSWNRILMAEESLTAKNFLVRLQFLPDLTTRLKQA